MSSLECGAANLQAVATCSCDSRTLLTVLVFYALWIRWLTTVDTFTFHSECITVHN